MTIAQLRRWASRTYAPAAGNTDLRDTLPHYVRLPPGVFTLDFAVVAQGPLCLEGCGIGVTVLRLAPAGPTGTLLQFGGPNVVLRALTIDGNLSAQAASSQDSALVLFKSASNSVLRDVEVKGALRNALRVESCDGVTLDNVWAHGSGRRGVWCIASARVGLQLCRAWDNGADGIDIDGFCQQVDIVAAQAYRNTRHGLFIEETTHDVSVLGGKFYGNTQHGIALNHQTEGTLSRVGITGAVCTGNGLYGVCVRGNMAGAFVEDVTISNVISQDNTEGGLLLGANPDGGCSEVNVEGGSYQSIVVEATVGAGTIANVRAGSITNASENVTVI